MNETEGYVHRLLLQTTQQQTKPHRLHYYRRNTRNLIITMPTSTPSSSSSSTSRSFVSMTGILVSVLCAAALGGGLATLMHQQKEAALQHRLALFDTKLTELTATVSMLTTMTTGTDTDTDTGTGSSSSSNRRLSTPLSDNDLVCTPFRAWLLSGIYPDNKKMDSNLTVRSLRSFVVG